MPMDKTADQNQNPNKYFNNQVSTWCPGCGNIVIKAALSQALAELKLPPEKVVLTFDIGCISNSADEYSTYVFKSLHGRAIPPAVGIKLANPELTVVSILGDGGAYGEGIEHLISSAKRDDNITVIVANNEIYALTTGQTSPTTPKDKKTISYPDGSPDRPIDPIKIAIAAGATFVAREISSNPKELTELIKQGITHQGFALIDVLQHCITWNGTDWLTQLKDKIQTGIISEAPAE